MSSKTGLPTSPPDGAIAAAAAPKMGGVPVMDSLQLLQGGREVLILHGGDCYRPVSYTHLDVYKRQVEDRPRHVGS